MVEQPPSRAPGKDEKEGEAAEGGKLRVKPVRGAVEGGRCIAKPWSILFQSFYQQAIAKTQAWFQKLPGREDGVKDSHANQLSAPPK